MNFAGQMRNVSTANAFPMDVTAIQMQKIQILSALPTSNALNVDVFQRDANAMKTQTNRTFSVILGKRVR